MECWVEAVKIQTVAGYLPHYYDLPALSPTLHAVPAAWRPLSGYHGSTMRGVQSPTFQ
jgi:hypothetical protein